MDIAYSVLNGSWQIAGTISQRLLDDLRAFGLPERGNFRETSDIAVIEASLNNAEKLKRFVAGLTDTVGSLAASHRHRVDSAQIISYEFKGKNFTLVAQLVSIFNKMNCYPDQILWNHPNFHSGQDRYYSSWKKGFKLRIALTDYMLAGSFVSEAKKLSAKENFALTQTALATSHTDSVRISGRTSLHKAENSEWLPESVRGKHFVHYAHLAYSLGALTNGAALTYLKIKLRNPGALVCPFTILTKGTRTEIEEIIRDEPYLRQSSYRKIDLSSSYLSAQINKGGVENVFGLDNERGFPLNQVIHAVTYVGLAESGSDQLKGNRILGTDGIKRNFLGIEPNIDSLGIEILKPDKGTCLLIRSRRFAALVGYADNDFNNGLIDYDEDTLTLKIREPLYAECVDLR